MKYNNQIQTVIVLYKIRLADSRTFVSLTRSLETSNFKLDLLVYDNSPEYNIDSSFEYPNWQITYHPDENNGGVSKAYNYGVSLASLTEKKWIILFDQDTKFPANTIHEYLQAISNYPNDKLFSPIMIANRTTIISPCYFKFMRGFAAKDINVGVNSLNEFSVINCGMCIDIEAFKKNGGYNEQIKLDFSDHDFIHRFKKTATERFIVMNLRVDHELSTTIKNSKTSDLVRFDYYLQGSKLMSSSTVEKALLSFNALMRSLKLSLAHKSLSFLIKMLK